MPQLLVHPDVHAYLNKLDVSVRDFVRQKVIWAETQLAMTGRSSRVKGTRAQAWRRTPVRGNQYYLWWAPADEVGVGAPDVGPGIAVRDLRHHDNLVPPTPAPRSAYHVVDPRSLDPRSAIQASVARSASPSGMTATIVRGQPGTGKTLSLLYAARDFATSQRILYITYTPQLVEDALLFAKTVGIDDKLVVMTLSALESAILREPQIAPTENPKALGQRFDDMVRSLDSSVVGAWSNKGYALWAEARACLIGMALPFAWRRGSLTVPSGEILDLGIYCDMSGLDADVAEKARHIADLARLRGLLADQTRARAALDALMNGDTGNLSVEGVGAVFLDEAQDLTPIEFALLLELPRVIAKRDHAALFIAAGDESQTVHPSGFEWGVAKDLIRERLGCDPNDVVLGQMMRSPDAILSIINKTGSLYKTLPKNFRPGGAVTHNAPPTDDAGRVLQCEIPQNGDYADLVEALLMTPGRAVVTLEPSKGDEDPARSAGVAITFTPAEIKGLERRIIIVTGLDETLGILNRLTTGSAYENRSLESLEARYLIDGVRVALSRATETLVLLRSDSGIPGLERSSIDLIAGVKAIEWDELLSLVREDDISDEERIEGFLAEAREHEQRGDARRAIERIERADALGKDISDAKLAESILELRRRIERDSGLRIVVGPEGGDFASLQEAIKQAPKGAFLQVQPGTYSGPFFINKDMKIEGDGPRGSVVLTGDARVILIEGCKVTLEGLSIWRLKRAEDLQPRLEGRLLKEVRQWGALSIAVDDEDEIDIPERILEANTKLMAVEVHYAQLSMRSCEVISEDGIGIFGTISHVYVEGCVVHRSLVAIVAGHRCTMTIERTEMKDGKYGIVSGDLACLQVRRSVLRGMEWTGISLNVGTEARIEDNEIVGMKQYGIHVLLGVTTMVTRNRIRQCHAGIKVDEDGGGVFEKNDIADSLHVGFWVGPGGDPLVQNNRFRTSNLHGVFIDLKGGGRFEGNQIVDNVGTGLTICGEGVIAVRNTLIQGNAAKDPSVYIGEKMVGVFEGNEVCRQQGRAIVIQLNAGAGFVVRKNRVHHNVSLGIVCRGIDCVVEDNELFENGNVGLCAEHKGSPKAQRNRIHHNGAGIVVRNGGSGLFEDNDVYAQKDIGVAVDKASGIFRKNRISKAPRFGVLVTEESKPLFEENDISDSGTIKEGANVCVTKGAQPMLRSNKIHGGVIGVRYLEHGQGLLEGNEIRSLSRIGVDVHRGSTPMVRGNRIHGTAEFGIVVASAGVTVENNDVFKIRGIGIRVESADVVVQDNRVHDNTSGGIMIHPKSKGVFERNEVIENKKWGFIVGDSADPTIRDNRVQGSIHGIVVCKGARGTYIGNDVRGNVQLGLHIDPEAGSVRNEGNISDEGSAKPLGPSQETERGHRRKKGRGK